MHGSLNMNRQMFFAGTGGFDNHENLITSQVNLMNGFDLAHLRPAAGAAKPSRADARRPAFEGLGI